MPHAAFSPDGTRIVTASWDGSTRVWDVASGALLGVPFQGLGGVNTAAWSPDNQHIVVASLSSNPRTSSAVSSASPFPVQQTLGPLPRQEASKDATTALKANVDKPGAATTKSEQPAQERRAPGEGNNYRALERPSPSGFSDYGAQPTEQTPNGDPATAKREQPRAAAQGQKKRLATQAPGEPPQAQSQLKQASSPPSDVAQQRPVAASAGPISDIDAPLTPERARRLPDNAAYIVRAPAAVATPMETVGMAARLVAWASARPAWPAGLIVAMTLLASMAACTRASRGQRPDGMFTLAFKSVKAAYARASRTFAAPAR